MPTFLQLLLNDESIKFTEKVEIFMIQFTPTLIPAPFNPQKLRKKPQPTIKLSKTMRYLQSPTLLLFFFLAFISIQTLQVSAQNLSPSQIKTLLRLQRILEHPPSLSALNNATNFCYLPSSPSLSISCFGTRITELSINGDSSRPLSPAFSADSLFATLSRLPSLTTLSLVSLGIWGPLPSKLGRLSALRVLNLSSNHLNGEIPAELSSMAGLQSLVLSGNSFSGTVPDLKILSSLTELDLSGNQFGPEFPLLSKSLVSIVLKNNTFRGNVPMGLASFDQLQKLDLSLNQLNGKIPPFLFSLPSLQFLDLAGNRFSGALPSKLSCGEKLGYADISSNLLLGGLPSCVGSNSSSRVVLSSWNCLSSGDSRYQHQKSYCSRDPLAAVLPTAKEEESKSKVGLILGIVGGIIGGAAVVGLLVFLVFRKARSENVGSVKLPKPVAIKTPVQLSPKAPTDTRHMSQAVRIGALGLTPYRVFTMEELEEATNGFDSLNLISDGPQGKFYKGWLWDGSTVVVRCLKLKQRLSAQSLIQYMDVIAKLRHVNLVSILGHCIPSCQDNASTNDAIFLVLEYVSNGTLRSHLTEWRKREMLKWPQRVAAVIGVVRGIQFLHTVTVPGIVGNDLGIENIVLDETLTAKISNYNLPMLLKNKNNKIGSESPFSTLEDNDRRSVQSLEHGEKEDVYQLGLILFEIITGKPAGSQREVEALKVELQDSLADGPAKLKEITDPIINETFALDSLQTLITVALNCVANDHRERPSIDDILWNLQYSQVQDGWTSSEGLSIHPYN